MARHTRDLQPIALAGGAVALLLLGLGVGLFVSGRFTSVSSPRAKLPAGRGETGPSSASLGRPDPTNVKALLAYGHQALDQENASEAVWAYRQVLTLESNNVEAITHTGLLLFQSGAVDQGLAHLDRALGIDPRYAHALWDKAQVLFHAKRDYEGAIKTLEQFLALISRGEDADRARAMIAKSRARAVSAASAGPRRSSP